MSTQTEHTRRQKRLSDKYKLHNVQRNQTERQLSNICHKYRILQYLPDVCIRAVELTR